MARGKREREEPTYTDPAAMATRTSFTGLLEAARCLRRGKLERAHAALRKVAGALPPQHLDDAGRCFCLWAREVRDLCHDMEDALDDDAYYLRPPPPKLLFRDRVMALMFSTKKKEKRIEMASSGVTEGFTGRLEWLLATNERARDAAIQLMRITVGPCVDPRPRPVYRGVDSRDLVGMDHARDELIRLLLTASPHGGGGDQPVARRRTVVSVLGSAGLGKTTLAKAAYDRLEAQFDCRVFVRVGPDPIIDHVLTRILRTLDGDKYDILVWETVDLEQLIRETRHFLCNKRYLVVVDDVWYPQDWEAIDQALPDNGRGSRVITTTRHPRVAARAGGRVYRPEPLSDVDARRLFFKRVFGGEGRCPDDSRLAEVTGAMVLKKCGGGSPLAIISMASVVAARMPRWQWSTALSYSMDSVQEAAAWPYRDNRCVERLRRALSLSYYDLPCLLRLCLLHLGAFPKGYPVEKDTLIWRWVAEGFVHPQAGMSLYELGESYLNELVNRGVIEACSTQGCRVHPMMLSVARYFSTQENFVTVVDSDRRHSCWYARRDKSCDCCLAPRLAMHGTRNVTNIEAALGYSLNKARVRSLDGRRLCCVEDMPQLLGSFHGLRLLALEHCRGGAVGSEHLKVIGKLRHLRYLGLLGTRVAADELEAAGEAVGGLRLLQTLDLRGTAVKALPPAVFELTQLTCLCVDGASVGGEQWSEMRKLVSLEEVRLRCGNGGADDCSRSLEHLAGVLDGLPELRVVEISGLDQADGVAVDALLKSLPKLNKIRRLALRYNGDDLVPHPNWSDRVRFARSASL